MDLSKITMYDACLLHSRAERVLKSLVSKHLETFKVTRMEWLLLASVEQPSKATHGHTMGELAALLDIRLSQVTALVTTMHEASLITQKVSQKDRRTRYVRITPKGSKVLEKVELSMRQALGEWLRDIPRAQLATYLQTVDQLGVK